MYTLLIRIITYTGIITYIKIMKIYKILKKSKNLGYYRYILKRLHLIDRSALSLRVKALCIVFLNPVSSSHFDFVTLFIMCRTSQQLKQVSERLTLTYCFGILRTNPKYRGSQDRPNNQLDLTDRPNDRINQPKYPTDRRT